MERNEEAAPVSDRRAHTSVIVNGSLIVENAAHTAALPGKVLRREPGGAGCVRLTTTLPISARSC
jgi:hypothetical protein